MEDRRSGARDLYIRRPLIRAVVLFLFPAALFALPSYAEVQKKLPDLWNARYPVAAEKFTADPERRGLLVCTVDGRAAYYYNFRAVVPVMMREGEELKPRGTRTIELWVQHIPVINKYELYMERYDRLPGAGKRWVK